MTVSGVDSARRIRSGFRTKPCPLMRLRWITVSVPGVVTTRPWVVPCGVAVLLVRWWCGSCLLIGRGAGELRVRGAAAASSALDVDQVLQDLVGGGDDPRVRLEAALGDDQVGELLRQVDVRHLQDAARELAARAAAGGADLRDAAVRRGRVGGVARLDQAGRVVERRQGDLA